MSVLRTGLLALALTATATAQETVMVDGPADAQFIFETDQGERLMSDHPVPVRAIGSRSPEGIRNTAMTIYRIPTEAQGFLGRPK